MAYSTISKPKQHFDTLTYTGNGSSPRTLTGLGHQPDWLWFKLRDSGAVDHASWDTVRGVTTGVIHPNTTAAQNTTQDHGKINAVTSDGFTVADGPSGSYPRLWVNDSSAFGSGANQYVVWSWKANGGTTASNSDGAITSTISLNSTAGFSIVKYTGNGNSTATVGHGLGSKPDVVIAKRYSSGTNNWRFYSRAILGDSTSNTLFLNTDGAVGSDADRISAVADTTFTAAGTMAASSIDFVCYCFKNIKGYSRFGKYIGNNNVDGTFVYTGFKPAFVMVKRTDAADNWFMLDNKRNTLNPKDRYLRSDLINAEAIYTFFDFVSNGFKIRSTGGGHNNDGASYFFMAFAEEPLVANVGESIPATAR